MSGHSKWATIKLKAKVDAQRGKLFTRLARRLLLLPGREVVILKVISV